MIDRINCEMTVIGRRTPLLCRGIVYGIPILPFSTLFDKLFIPPLRWLFCALAVTGGKVEGK